MACRISVPRPGIEPIASAVETQSLNHWTTREVQKSTEHEIFLYDYTVLYFLLFYTFYFFILRLKVQGVTEDETVGWHHQLKGHEFAQTLGDGEGQGSLVCCSP